MTTYIVVPCYNEANRLDQVAFLNFLKLNPAVCVLMVDDGSTDKTLDLLNDFQTQLPQQIEVFSLGQNQGKAEAVRRGLLLLCDKVDADYIGFWDADLATPLSDVLTFKKFLDDHEKYQLIMGCRLIRLGANIERKFHRYLLGRIFATLISFHLGLPTYDTQCGAKLFRKPLLKELIQEPFKTSWFFDVEMLRRMRDVIGRKTMLSAVYEYPLPLWIDIGDSKVQLLKTIPQFFKLLTSR